MSDITLLGGEEMKMKLSQHMFSFFNLYFIFFFLLLWGLWIYDFFVQESFKTFPAYDILVNVPFVNEVTVGALCWALGLFIVGFAAPIAVVALGIGEYTSSFLQIDSNIIATGIILIVGTIHFFGTRSGGLFQNIVNISHINLGS